MAEQKYRTCNLCEAMCGMVVEVDQGRVTGIRGDRDDVFSRGHICPKGPAMRELYEDPDRLRHPMRRTSSGRFERVTWDEALREAAERLVEIQTRHGKSSVGTYIGNPTVHNTGAILMAQALFSALRTRNRFDANSQDANPRLFASHHMFGDIAALTVPDIDRTHYMLMLGANPLASNGSIMTLGDVRGRLKGIRERGGKLVVIDPRRTETAELANEHHFIRPGGDAALVAAMLHVIFAERLVQSSPVYEMASGLSDLESAVAPFSPERVERAVGLSAPTIERLAREFAAAESAVAYSRVGVSQNAFGPTASWLVDALNVVTQNFDRPGGAMFTKPAINLNDVARRMGLSHVSRFRSRVRGLPEVGGMLPAATIAEEIETPGEGQIRGMVTLAGNPVLSVPGGERLSRALASLDFMVSIDIYLNETTRHANLVLPPRSGLERAHYDLIFHAIAVRNTAKYSEPSVTPDPEGRDDWDILYELSMRIAAERAGGLRKKAIEAVLGLGSPSMDFALDVLLRFGPYGDKGLPWRDGLNLQKLKAAPHGIDLGPLVPMRHERVSLPGRRVNLAPKPFLDDMARVEAWVDQAQKDELLLIGRRHVRSNNSWMHNIPSLVKGPSRSALMVHPDDAKRLGLAKGSLARITGRAASVTARVELTADMMPGVVSLPHGFGHAPAAGTLRVAGEVEGPSMNAVTDEQQVEPLTGTAILAGVPVSVAPVVHATDEASQTG